MSANRQRMLPWSPAIPHLGLAALVPPVSGARVGDTTSAPSARLERALVPRQTAAGQSSAPRPASVPGGPNAVKWARTLPSRAPAPNPNLGRRPRRATSLDDADLVDGEGGAGAAEAVGANDGSSSGPDAHLPLRRRARKKARTPGGAGRCCRARLRTDLALSAEVVGGALLGQMTATVATRKRYDKYLEKFYSERDLNDRAAVTVSDEALDSLMRKWFSDAYIVGEQSSFGEQTAAAFLNRHPEFG